MAFRLKLVPAVTNIDFFRYWKITFGASVLAMVIGIVSLFTQGLALGIDFQGGTSIRTETANPVNIGEWRESLTALNLGDVTITEVFDPGFRPDQHVAQVRVQGDVTGEVTPAQVVERVEAALLAIDPSLEFTSVESVGPKVSGELMFTAILSLSLASLGILIYIWLRFEWQFAVGAVVALVHDAFLTVAFWSVFQFKFDLTIVAAVLTIIGYSVNDTVVVFDRVRENLIKYKTMPLKELLNLTINETLSRTIMTSTTTMLALIAMFSFGGDVIRGFIAAMMFGVMVGIYSTVYVASVIVLMTGINRNPTRDKAGTQFNTSA
jgi:preprotein translocase subunit SecF